MPVDMSRFHRSILDEAISTARKLQSQGRVAECANAWEKAAEKAELFASTAISDSERGRRLQTARRLRELAVEAKGHCGVGTAVTKAADDVDEFRETVRRLIHKSSVSFDDIAGLKETTREIRSTFALSLAQVPVGIVVPRTSNVLFYGPPGCGKTLLAAAVSNGIDATFFSVKVSDLLSRYFGDSPKLVRALYEEARSHANSVIFLDEFDAIATSRSDLDSSADRRLLVSLLSELDGLNEKGGGNQVLTIAATNRPWELDEAILSRFEKSIFIPLPDRESRSEILRIHLQQKGHALVIAEDLLLDRTEGLSGRELAHLCKLMIEIMIADANPDLADVASRGGDAIRSYSIRITPITQGHFDRARGRVQPRTSADGIELFRRWASDE